MLVFRFAHFRFSVGDLVQQSFIGFVGFDRAALITIFPGALFPLLYVQFQFFAFFQAFGVSFFCRRQGRLGPVQLGVRVPDAFGKRFQFGAQRGKSMIDLLQIQKERQCGMHARKF